MLHYCGDLELLSMANNSDYTVCSYNNSFDLSMFPPEMMEAPTDIDLENCRKSSTVDQGSLLIEVALNMLYLLNVYYTICKSSSLSAFQRPHKMECLASTKDADDQVSPKKPCDINKHNI